MPVLRLSPSGPPIGNVGPGFTLRLDEGTTTIDPGFGTWTPATAIEVKYDPATALAPFLRPSLTLPQQNRRYRVTGAFDVQSANAAATATITTSIWVSYDEAASWQQLVNQESLVLFEQTKHIRIDQVLTLGSALAEPVPSPPPATMQVKLLVESNITNVQFAAPGGTSGAAFLQLTEHL